MKTAICFFASFYALFAQNDSLVKYYSTEIIRSNIIKGRPEIEVDINEAHFKAIYHPSGRLKSIEYISLLIWLKIERIKPTEKS